MPQQSQPLALAFRRTGRFDIVQFDGGNRMPTVLLSYRREDAQGTTGRIFDRLAARYGRDKVFMDVDSIPIGVNFRDHIRTYIEKSDVVLVIIGPSWNVPGDNGKRRLSNPKDWVRIEIEMAIELGISLVPVCVDGASIPAPKYLPRNLRDLPLLNAAIVHPGRDFDSHVQRLIREVDGLARPTKGSRSRRDRDGQPHGAAKRSLGRFNVSSGAPQPTLEEILGSIRRIVADNESKGRPSLVSDTNKCEKNESDEDDILDLVNELDAPMAEPGEVSAQLSEKVAESSPDASAEVTECSDPKPAGANVVRTPSEEAALILKERMTAIRAEMSVQDRPSQPVPLSPKG